MNTISVKIIFLIFNIFIFLYCSSYAKFEIVSKNNIFGGLSAFLFTTICVIFSTIIFFIT